MPAHGLCGRGGLGGPSGKLAPGLWGQCGQLQRRQGCPQLAKEASGAGADQHSYGWQITYRLN